MGNTYRLILQSGASMGTEYPLDKNEIILGRDLSNDLVINDPEVSRRHLKFVIDGATYRIEDLGSTNGTFIHGQRLSSPMLLRPGEIITLGEKVVLRYEVTSPSDPNATVVASRVQPMETTAAARTPVTPTPSYTPPVPQSAPVVPPAPTPIAPPPAQSYQPVTPRPQPGYQPIAAAPAYPPMGGNPPMQPAAPKKKSKLVLILIIVAGAILLFCVIPAIIIDLTNSYCALAPGIMNSLFGAVCP